MYIIESFCVFSAFIMHAKEVYKHEDLWLIRVHNQFGIWEFPQRCFCVLNVEENLEAKKNHRGFSLDKDVPEVVQAQKKPVESCD